MHGNTGVWFSDAPDEMTDTAMQARQAEIEALKAEIERLKKQ